jgi:hypothetical protein
MSATLSSRVTSATLVATPAASSAPRWAANSRSSQSSPGMRTRG